MLGLEVVVHWAPHYVGGGDSGEGDRFLGAPSLLAVLHRIFLADEFVFSQFVILSFHSGLLCYITMNKSIVLNNQGLCLKVVSQATVAGWLNNPKAGVWCQLPESQQCVWWGGGIFESKLLY